MKDEFSDWIKWKSLFWDKRKDKLLSEKLSCPGIYVIAKTRNVSDQKFTWLPDIVYIGMTSTTLWIRLNAFRRTIEKYPNESQHGGADRVRLEYKRLDKEKKLKTWFDDVYFSFYRYPNTTFV
jgi:hypothetical protein